MQNQRIFIIEDESLHSEMYGTMFEQEGFDVERVLSGDAAVSRIDSLSSIDARPDAIVLDIMLPGFSGFSVLEHIRRNPLTKHTPVVVATNLALEEIRDKATALGATAVILKATSTPKDIVEKVKALIKASSGQ